MPNFDGLVLCVGEDKLRFSTGCRELAWNHSDALVMFNGRRDIAFDELVLNKQIKRGEWTKHFGALCSNFQYVSRVRDNKTARDRVAAFMQASPIEDYKILRQAVGFNSKAKGAAQFLYCLHTVARDSDYQVVSDVVPVPKEQIMAGLTDNDCKVVESAYLQWFEKGLPYWGRTERDVVVSHLGACKAQAPFPAPNLPAMITCYYPSSTKGEKVIKANDGKFSATIEVVFDEPFPFDRGLGYNIYRSKKGLAVRPSGGQVIEVKGDAFYTSSNHGRNDKV